MSLTDPFFKTINLTYSTFELRSWVRNKPKPIGEFMKSKLLTVMMTALSTLAPALTLMSPSLAHAKEGFVCKLNENPLFGIKITFAGPTIPHPTGVSKEIHFDPNHETQTAVVVTFFGPQTSNSVKAFMTSFHSETRVGPETNYFIDLGQNESIGLTAKYWSYNADEEKFSFTGTYRIPGKFYQLTCK
jgi:hypothetical protein